MAKAVVVFSGGPDSTAAALWAMSEGYDVELLTFQFKNKEQYGELKAAIQIASMLHLPHTIFDFKSPMQHFRPDVHILMHSGVADGNADSKGAHRLNFGAGMILATTANYALYNGKGTVIWGATLDDAFGGKFDYTQEFCDLLATAVEKSSKSKFSIIAPFSKLHKHEILKKHFIGREELFSMTWSCKMGGIVQSGDCHASKARRIAARLAGIDDTTIYSNQEIIWPFSEAQFQNTSGISDDELARIFESEKQPEFE